MEKFKDIVATILVYIAAIVLIILCGTLILTGVLTIFGSMFFEVTASQLTLMIVLQHIGIFFGGAFILALGLSLGGWILSKTI